MKDFDNIEDWYRDELNKFNVEPDNNVWQSLSDDLDADMTLTDENISEWYKREVSKLEERPDYTVWEKLATKLDTASVWDRLVVSLNRHEQYIWWRNVIIKGSAILLLLTSSYVTYNKYFGNDNSETISKNNTPVNQENSKTNTTNSTQSKFQESNNTVTAQIINEETLNNKEDKRSTALRSKNTNTNSISKAIAEAKEQTSIQKDTKSSDYTTYSSLNNTSKEKLFNPIVIDDLSRLKTSEEKTLAEFERRTITERDISHIYNSSDFLVKKEKNKIVFNSKRFSSYTSYGIYARRLYFGINAGVKKQGLITRIAKDNYLSNYNQIEYLDFGHNFGITTGYILSDKVNIEANININSTSGYERRFNGPENNFHEELNLNYTTLNLLAKKMNTKSTFDNKVYSTNFIGGVYASYLTSSSTNINGVKQKLDTYQSSDFGFVLGIEQDRYISKTFIITPSVRYNQGLVNVANKNNAFNSARNFSLEFNLGIKYILLKKSN